MSIETIVKALECICELRKHNLAWSGRGDKAADMLLRALERELLKCEPMQDCQPPKEARA
jgi:hypothetical protein